MLKVDIPALVRPDITGYLAKPEADVI